MKKDSARGWKDVFTFTLTQTVKSKSYIISLIFMIVCAMVSMPIMNMILKDDITDGSEKSAIEKVYVYNMTMCQNLSPKEELTEGYAHIVFENATVEISELETKLQEDETNSVILVLMEDENYCYIQFERSPNGDVTMMELQMLGQYIQNAFTKAKVELLGLTEAQVKFFETSVVASAAVVDTKSDLMLEDTSITRAEYWFIYGVMFFVLMTCVMASSQVATSIVQEKSSKVIEYLLTSIRPLAVIIGKVLAMLVTVMLQMMSLVLAGYVSTKIGTLLTGQKSNAITRFMTPEMLESLNAGNIILGLVVAGAGLVLYATLAGLCGATASRMEEAGESLSLLTITSLIGFYIGFGAAGSLMAAGDNAFVTFALIFPVSSAFLLPAALLVGKADLGIALIAIAVLIISIVLMFRFVAKVYEGLILHNGARLKLKDVFAMAKGSKAQKSKKEENA